MTFYMKKHLGTILVTISNTCYYVLGGVKLSLTHNENMEMFDDICRHLELEAITNTRQCSEEGEEVIDRES